MSKTILLQNSHTLNGREISGAPGEGAFVLALNAMIESECAQYGISVVRVDGDIPAGPGSAHPEYKTPGTSLFFAPHYDADLYTDAAGFHLGGAFWGRASTDPVGAESDRLGNLLWRNLRKLPGAPTPHFDRMNPNVTSYFAFNLTPAIPGVLMEHGVGAPVCNGHGQLHAPDFQWLRDNAPAIARGHAAAFAEFLGVSAQTPTTGTPTTPSDPAAKGDTIMTPDQERKLDRVLQLLESREPLVWLAREQRNLDVETGKAFDATSAPHDPRIKQ